MFNVKYSYKTKKQLFTKKVNFTNLQESLNFYKIKLDKVKQFRYYSIMLKNGNITILKSGVKNEKLNRKKL